jgi:hypothetical protein
LLYYFIRGNRCQLVQVALAGNGHSAVPPYTLVVVFDFLFPCQARTVPDKVNLYKSISCVFRDEASAVSELCRVKISDIPACGQCCVNAVNLL